MSLIQNDVFFETQKEVLEESKIKNRMRKINLVRKIIFFPFKIIFSIIFLVVGFFMTDFESPKDRKYFKENMIDWYKF